MPPPPPTLEAARLLGKLHQLTVRACRAQTIEELRFLALNESIELVPYDRASLWRAGTEPGLLGFSGQVEAPRSAPLAVALRALWREAGVGEAAVVLGRKDAPESAWGEISGGAEGASILWLPIRGASHAAGLALERRAGGWSEEEVRLLSALADGYGAAWSKFERAARPKAFRAGGRRIAIGAAVLLAVLLLPVRMKIVAPCEIVPEDLRVVAAPIEGVIDRVEVRAGDRVRKGDLLFAYDPRLPRQNLAVAEEQVRVVEAQLKRAQARVLDGDEALGELAVLEHRLAQEKARFALAAEAVGKIEVRAETDGEALIDRPEEWRGKPVSVGERVVGIADPARTRVRIWIPEADLLPLGEERSAVAVYLNIAPERSLTARTERIAPAVSLGPNRAPSFLAEAEWDGPAAEARPGLKGTAILRGPRACFGYWLLRKPWSWLRRVTGI